ncbi:hypothetical protein O1611_g1150 [Lasiodiplodia mahajangana]|uniref:Uncharacterized protein n=1 Tax=Lasiodiplodia mahajangana TaxID=1108764 RepID=A0ACC2JYB9_9PEZI|nr:hypothetical protein O1611_g1150 [Lasiodiplodia mahajangana]
MGSQLSHEEFNGKASELDEPSESSFYKSYSFSELEKMYDWDSDEMPRGRAERRHNCSFSTRRPRRRSTDRHNEDDIAKIDSASEARRNVFIGISKASRRFLVQYLSACESVRSTSESSSPSASITGSPTSTEKQRDVPTEGTSLPTSEVESESWHRFCWRMDSFYARLSQWQSLLYRSDWRRIFEGSGKLRGVRDEISSSLICLAENALNLFEQSATDIKEIDPWLRKTTEELSSLVLEGKKVQLNNAVSESEFSATTGDLDAIEQCIVHLETILCEKMPSLVPGIRPLSLRKHELPSSPVLTNRGHGPFSFFPSVTTVPTSLSPTSHLGEPSSGPPKASIFMPSAKSGSLDHKHVRSQQEMELEQVLERRAKRRISTAPSTAEKIPRLQPNPSFLAGPSAIELKEAEKNLSLIHGENLSERLRKLVILKDLWEKAKPTQDMHDLITDMPPFATVLISTDPSDIERFPLELDEVKGEPSQSEEDNIGRLVETMSNAQLIDDSLPSGIAEGLMDKIYDSYREVLDEGQASNILPGLSDAYAKIESSLALLESIPDWVLHAQPDYIDNVVALLPIIQSCLLDCLLEIFSEFPTQLENLGTPVTSEPSQALGTISVLGRSIERLGCIEISPSLKVEWERLQQPLQEVIMEIDSLHDDLTQIFACAVSVEEKSDKGATTQPTQQDEDMGLTQNSCGSSEITLPDMVIPAPIHLLFYVTYDSEESGESSDKFKVSMESFVARTCGDFMVQVDDTIDEDALVALDTLESDPWCISHRDVDLMLELF